MPSLSCKKVIRIDGIYVILRAFLDKENDAITITIYQPSTSSKHVVELPISEAARLLHRHEVDEIDEDDLSIISDKLKNRIEKIICGSPDQLPLPPNDISERERLNGNVSFREGKFDEAKDLYIQAIKSQPEDPTAYLNLAAVHINLLSFNEALDECKKTISLIRRLQFQKKTQNNYDKLISKAYYRMGTAYEGLSKETRAVTAYVLSIKFGNKNETGDARNAIERITGGSSRSNITTNALNQTNDNARTKNFLPDVEDIIENHQIKKYSESFGFSCTMCGECCRTSDNILLSPLDMFNISRSPSVRNLGIRSTMQLLIHKRFKSAFHFILRKGLPLSYLRPLLSQELGHCHFAYPLYTEEVLNVEIKNSSDQCQSHSHIQNNCPPYDDDSCTSDMNTCDEKIIHTATTSSTAAGGGYKYDLKSEYDSCDVSDDETKRQGQRQGGEGKGEQGRGGGSGDDDSEFDSDSLSPPPYCEHEDNKMYTTTTYVNDNANNDDDNDNENENSKRVKKKRVLLSYEDTVGYDLCESSLSLLSESAKPLDSSEYNITEDEEEEDKDDDDVDNDDEDEEDESPQAVYNSFGRQALGCMLGVQGMPTLCASYPVAAELSQIDFWHVRRRSSNHNLKDVNGGTDVDDSDAVRPPRPPDGRQRGYGGNAHDLNHGNGNDDDGGGGGSLSPYEYSSWKQEEHYIILRSSNCEGFCSDSTSSCTPIRNGVYIEDTNDAPADNLVTVKNFLGTTNNNSIVNVDNVISSQPDRLEEFHWFLALTTDISFELAVDTIQPEKLRTKFVNILAKIWYNFDALHCASARPIRSYGRLRREIESLTWTIVRETKRFLMTNEKKIRLCDEKNGNDKDGDVEITSRNAGSATYLPTPACLLTTFHYPTCLPL
eukprot:gene6636-13445_t